MTGNVHEFKEPCWRLHYPHGDWEELTKSEMERHAYELIRGCHAVTVFRLATSNGKLLNLLSKRCL